MNKFIIEGIVISAIIAAAFLLYTNYIPDYGSQGFPFPYSEGWGPCLSSMECSKNTPENMALDIAIAVIIGFGISYVKNSKVKK